MEFLQFVATLASIAVVIVLFVAAGSSQKPKSLYIEEYD